MTTTSSCTSCSDSCGRIWLRTTAIRPEERTVQVEILARYSLYEVECDLQGVLRMIVIDSKKPLRPLFGFLTPSKRWVKIVGTSRSPTPNESAAASTKRSRRVKRLYDRTRKPETATLANKKVVTPPRTELGTADAWLDHTYG